jgi:predicted esterase
MKNSTLVFLCGIKLITSGCMWAPTLTTNKSESYAMESIKDDVQKGKTTEPQLTMPGIYRLEAPKAKSSFVVYVPQDYTSDRVWPVIFCYHGAGGSATTWPFQQITRGEGFIIVGMNYATEAYSHGLGRERIGPEQAFFAEALSIVSSQLNINPKMVFMGGYSQGGYSTTILGEQLLDQLAGLIILGASRSYVDRYPPPAKQIQGKPIFIGVGENDERKPQAKETVQIYKDWGADVTFEEWPGARHGDEPKETKLLDWLLANGPLKDVESRLTAARQAEKAGELGEALTLYHQVSELSQSYGACIEAAKAAERLTQQAEKQLAEAEAVGQESYIEADKLLTQIAKAYAGSVFEERARQQKKTLLNAKADALEAKAVAAEKAKDYKKALQLYELYLTYFPEADRYQSVKAHLEALKADLRR